jgi:DNA polymerase-3 subunit gamma/tau
MADGEDGKVNVSEWSSIINEMQLTALVRELAVNCVFKGRSGDEFRLAIAPTKQHLRSERRESSLEQSLRMRYGESLHLVLTVEEPGALVTPAELHAQVEQRRRAAACTAIQEDPNVKTLCEVFGAEVEDISDKIGLR